MINPLHGELEKGGRKWYAHLKDVAAETWSGETIGFHSSGMQHIKQNTIKFSEHDVLVSILLVPWMIQIGSSS